MVKHQDVDQEGFPCSNGQQKCPVAPPQLIRQLLSSKMIDNSANLYDVTDRLFVFLYVGGCTVVSQPCVDFEA